MTSNELKERIENAKKKITSKEATIAKKTKWIKEGKAEAYILSMYSDDIKRLDKEIVNLENLLRKYENQLKQVIAEEEVVNNFPEMLKEMEKELVERWNAHDLATKERVNELYYNAIDRNEKKKIYNNFNDYEKAIFHAYKGDILKDNETKAHELVLSFYYRTKDITGDIIGWDNLYYSNGALNGYVEGVDGTAKVETIIAGGWNIQRLHVRVLVHKI